MGFFSWLKSLGDRSNRPANGAPPINPFPLGSGRSPTGTAPATPPPRAVNPDAKPDGNQGGGMNRGR